MVSWIVGSTTAAPSTTTTQYNTVGASNNSAWSSNEAARETVVPHALTLDQLTVWLTTAPSSGKSRTFTIFKNGLSTSLTVTISNTSTTASDLSDTVSCNAGDTISIQASESGTPTASGEVFWTIRQTATTAFAVLGFNNGLSVTGSGNYYNPQGFSLVGSTDALGQIVIPCAGTLQNLYTAVQAAPGASNSWAFTVVQNGTNSALTATISNTNVSANDTTHTLTVAAGDTISMNLAATGAITSSPGSYSMTFVPTTDGTSFLAFSANGHQPSTSTTNYNQPIGADFSWTATESSASVKAPATTVQGAYWQSSVSPGLSPKKYTMTLRQNVAGTSVTAAITDASTAVGSTRLANITGQSVSLSSGDNIATQSVPSGTPGGLFIKSSYIFFTTVGGGSTFIAEPPYTVQQAVNRAGTY